MKSVPWSNYGQCGHFHGCDFSCNWQIILEGIQGNGYQGDIAVDDVKFLNSTNCSGFPSQAIPDVNECILLSPCPSNTTCINTLGSYYCRCATGYTGSGSNCTDIDECSTGNYSCRINETCTNTVGSFICTCPPGLHCTDLRIIPIRNNGSSGRHEGRLEILHQGEWGTICENNWDIWDAEVACKDLGFKGALKALRGYQVQDGTGRIWLDNVICRGNETVLASCSHRGWGNHYCRHHNDAGLVCTDKDRSISVSCNFDLDVCGWKQGSSDIFDWKRHRYSTPTPRTGPDIDFTFRSGYYMYTEATYRNQSDNAQLVSPVIYAGNNTLKCLQFHYHKYGASNSTLNVRVREVNSTNSTIIWQMIKMNKNAWQFATVPTPSTGVYQIIFEGIRGNNDLGDVAIDDIEFNYNRNCSIFPDQAVPGGIPTATCDFDFDICGWKNVFGDQFDWTRAQGSTPTFWTGPNSDHTSGSGYYMYIEADGRNYTDKAWLVSPPINSGKQTKRCVQFYYHMYGYSIGTLNVRLRPINSSQSRIIWSLSGINRNYWQYARLPLPSSGPAYQIIFEGIRWIYNQGDIAVDDVTFLSTQCVSGFPPQAITDVNECVSNVSVCHSNATCTNTIGSYICTCKNGFSGDGTQCADVDECLSSPCFTGFVCVNAPGSYECVCQNNASICHGVCGIGFKGLKSRIVDGEEAVPGDWPWQATLYRGGSFLCGGSLIKRTWVVTAAHCVTNTYLRGYRIVLGDHARNTKDGNEQEFGVKRIIRHQLHNIPRFNHDIALIELDRPVKITKRVQRVCLPEQDYDVPMDATCYTTGWGRLAGGRPTSQTLQQVALPPLSTRKCQEKLKKFGTSILVTRNMICAGFLRGSLKASCNGDSGGPYVCQDKNSKWILQGITSWGRTGCVATEINSVYARAARYRSWIDYHTSK